MSQTNSRLAACPSITPRHQARSTPILLRHRLCFADVHAPFLHLIPEQPSRLLDIGSGPGHDAATLAGMGHAVRAAEPVPELLLGAMELHGTDQVQWIEDGLPELRTVRSLGLRFSLSLLSGVWMHLDPRERREGFPNTAALLDAGGVLAMSLRHGPVPSNRRMFDVTADETIDLAARSGLHPVLNVPHRPSIQAGNRSAGVAWTFLAFRA